MSNKNRKQFEDLYEQSYPMVLQMCLGYVKGDRDQAEDLTQEVFINIWNALEIIQRFLFLQNLDIQNYCEFMFAISAERKEEK